MAGIMDLTKKEVAIIIEELEYNAQDDDPADKLAQRFKKLRGDKTTIRYID